MPLSKSTIIYCCCCGICVFLRKNANQKSIFLNKSSNNNALITVVKEIMMLKTYSKLLCKEHFPGLKLCTM